MAFKGGLSTGGSKMTFPPQPPKTHGSHQHHVSRFPWWGHEQERLVLCEGELK